MDLELLDNARWLVGAVARGLHGKKHAGAGVVLDRLLDQRIPSAPLQQPKPQRLPVLSHLASAVAETLLIDGDLAAAIAAVEDRLHWRQSEAYSDAVMGPGFMANYGWCQIVGPHGFFAGDDFLLGLLMLGPGQHYRDHAHPAPELYWPLTAGSLWKRGASPFAEAEAGSLIWHGPHEVHATRTAASPMLAVWCWTKDTATPARLIAA